MPPSKDAILYAIESSLVTRVDTHDIEWFDIEGIVGRYSPILSHPLVNIVGKTNLTTENIDAIIQKVSTPFKKRKQILGWVVSPSTKPSDLAEHLKDAGFVAASNGAGLYLDDLTLPIIPSPDVTIRKANAADAEDVKRLYRDAYPLPENVTQVMLPFMAALNVINYLAFVTDEERPVAIASMYYMANSTIVALQGAATLESYRGRGIYTSLMMERLRDAHNDGMEVAIMQADRATSAPICKNLGFTEMCDVTIYAWMPPE